ncbi:hypothetical protein LV779_36475 [Streptomyces thinghirensis]|nr:hypothetical protein [Streptomyces thinghirensis]
MPGVVSDVQPVADAPANSGAPSHVAHQATRTRTYTRRRRASFALDVSILAALLAASSAPTPLYPLYQDQWGLSALAVTVVFSAYALALLLALLTTGALSDHLGRRPVTGERPAHGGRLHGPPGLSGRRRLPDHRPGPARCGHRRGHQLAAGAALLDLENPRHPGRSALANSVSPVAGMATGVLVSTLLVSFAPAPTVTVYVLLAALFLAQAIAATFATETAPPPRGSAAWSLRPRVGVPPRPAAPCWPRAPPSAPSGRWAASTPPSARPSYA